MVVCAGAWWFLNLYGLDSPGPHPPSWPSVAVWIAITLLCVAGGIWTVIGRKSRSRRWFVIGLLLGVGVTALIEGVCFAKP